MLSYQAEPLASRIRPGNLDDFIGQEHLVGPGKPLRQAMETGKLFSFVLWGPPGVGKTTLARLYAGALGADFAEISAVSAGKADIRKIVSTVSPLQKPTVLFIDEIHRFNKAQQDYLLPFVERGVVTLVGATTENPSFEVISPLLSRCRVFVLESLSEQHMDLVFSRAIQALDPKLKLTKTARNWLLQVANGDARQAITMIENTYQLYGKLTREALETTLQNAHLRFDQDGEEHYNTISAFIKSMRASNPDGALYYLARMIQAGEDPKFIARRMVIFASEDVGMGQPTALVVANEVFRAVETIGYPECAINLAHGAVYLACAHKDRSAYEGLKAAQIDVQKTGNLPIPMILRNAPTKLMQELGYGKGYEMYTTQNLLPEKLKTKRYFKPKQKP